MMAHHHFSHRFLQGKTCDEMKGLLQEIGEPWDQLPRFFTHGTYVRRQKVVFEPDNPWITLKEIPEKHRPTQPIVRTVVAEWEPPGRISYDWFVSGLE